MFDMIGMKGRTVLHIAAEIGILVMADLLAQRAFELALFLPDANQRTPLLVACAHMNVSGTYIILYTIYLFTYC